MNNNKKAYQSLPQARLLSLQNILPFSVSIYWVKCSNRKMREIRGCPYYRSLMKMPACLHKQKNLKIP